MYCHSFGLLLPAGLDLHAQNLEAGCKKNPVAQQLSYYVCVQVKHYTCSSGPLALVSPAAVGIPRPPAPLYSPACFFRGFLFTPGVPFLPVLCRLYQGLSSRPATFKDCRLSPGRAIFRECSTRTAHSTWQPTRAEHKDSLCTGRLVNSESSGAERQAQAGSGARQNNGAVLVSANGRRHLRASQCRE